MHWLETFVGFHSVNVCTHPYTRTVLQESRYKTAMEPDVNVFDFLIPDWGQDRLNDFIGRIDILEKSLFVFVVVNHREQCILNESE
ncbi:hypothetical protein D3C84_1160860 [compost metagenome]